MCGIFGVLAGRNAGFASSELQAILKRLYVLSESRGKESAGIHAYLPELRKAWTLKGDVPATTLFETSQYKNLIAPVLRAVFPIEKTLTATPMVILAHSRLVTNGAAERYENNQPVRYGGVTIIHNGIIVNIDNLWARYSQFKRRAEVDTEIIAALLDNAMAQMKDATSATRDVYREISGAATIAWVHDSASQAILATNTGDLYLLIDVEQKIAIFASERYILEQVVAAHFPKIGATAIQWVTAGEGVLFQLHDMHSERFYLEMDAPQRDPASHEYLDPAEHNDSAVVSSAGPNLKFSQVDESLLRYNEDRIRAIRRCSYCVLPETFPFIEFDEKGVCNYCRSYKPKYRDLVPEEAKQAFVESIQHYRSGNGAPDVLVPFSGGRDSCYGLHLIKKEFGFNPITFTYDWGMVTDLARRNIARLCSQLGVQNILVSADIKAKRENIRKNVTAWLKQPDLGMVPLFMAGDKHFFKIVNQLKRQTGISLDLWSANPLENTDFKSGFCGVSPDFDKKRVDYLSFARKVRLAAYYGKCFLKNPRYLNSSLVDTAQAFLSYYAEPRRNFFFMFNHIVWNEDEVNGKLIGMYNFELSPDSPSSWRIGDGTAPFYNYIYMTARGFCEFDTFRSNQIREGMISREKALSSILLENRPRVSSLRWYLDTNNLDFNSTIRRINELDTMGLHK